jgi:hypothetical protein
MTAFLPFTLFSRSSPKSIFAPSCTRNNIKERMELVKGKEVSSPDRYRDEVEEVVTPSTQDDDCIRQLLYAKSPEFDQDIAKTHSIVLDELKMMKEANEKLQYELNDKDRKATRRNTSV